MTNPDFSIESEVKKAETAGKIKITPQMMERAAGDLETHPEFTHMTLEQIAEFYRKQDTAEDRKDREDTYAVPQSAGWFRRSVGHR
ncbi:hypothetical protein HY045_01170 [Candidatus Woesebacteria bacterium]|nr:hypothetical protein [Candidatus Woesebacteria bacterium]